MISARHEIECDILKLISPSLSVIHQGSESSYEEMKEGVNVTYLDMKLSQCVFL